MRTSAAVITLLCLCGCSALPGFSDPRVTLTPQYALLEFNGDTRLQSPLPGGGVTTTNPDVGFRELGAGKRDGDIGGMVSIGDGFSGLDLAGLDIENSSAGTGTLSADWGNLMQGDEVRTTIDGFELRLRYLAQLLEFETEEELKLQLGAGAGLAHREIKVRAVEMNGLRSQNVEIADDGVVYGNVRGRLSYRGFGLQADYAVSPEANFGGDFDGILQDVEIAATYSFEGDDIVLSAGYRHSTLAAAGAEGDLDYEFDFTIEGFVVGVEFTF